MDFDGVLHTGEPPRDLRFAKHLTPIVSKLDLKVVISSTWREAYSLQAITEKLGDLGKHVVGKTPIWPSDELPEIGGRQLEIEAWLKKASLLEVPWVAIDDDRDNYRASCNRVFITDKSVGLDAAVAREFEGWCARIFSVKFENGNGNS